MKKIISVLSFFIIGTGLMPALAQSAEEIKNKIESKSFVFKALTAMSDAGSSRQLTSDYDLTVTGAKVISFLPYFGRVYSPSIPTEDGGIKFTSTNFEYKAAKPGKTWEVTIVPNDAADVRQLFLTIHDNGNATLQVISRTRQGISFRGYIK